MAPTRRHSRSHGPGRPSTAKNTLEIGGRVLTVSPVLDTLFHWMAERDGVRRKKMTGQSAPWTNDEILSTYSFTNVYRVFDRTTQYILKNVINIGDQDLYETCFRVMLFRTFNRISTWELLDSELDLTWRDFSFRAYCKVLRAANEDGVALYGHAYILPAPALGKQKNYENHLLLLQQMLEDRLPEKLVNAANMQDACSIISSYIGMGAFLSFQLLLDLNMTSHFCFSEDEWASVGPGSEGGLRKIFGTGVTGVEMEAMKYLRDTQYSHWARLGITNLPRLHPERVGVTLVDLEHSLCECEKYSRVKHPKISGKRKNIKQIYSAKPEPLTLALPEKWTSRGGTSSTPVFLHHLPDDEPLTALEESDPEYEVSRILDESPLPQGGVEYLVRWVGYGPEDDMWLEESALSNALDVLNDWWKKRKSRRRRPEILQS